VLSLIFLKFVSDRFEKRHHELVGEGKEAYVDMVEFYTMRNVFYLPEGSRRSTIVKLAKQNDIAVRIDSALHAVEKNNPSLKGAPTGQLLFADGQRRGQTGGADRQHQQHQHDC